MAKVLLADNSVTIQKVVELVLQDKGFELKSVSSGGEALAALDSFNPDIVLADVKLQDINGYELAEKVRGGAKTQNVPVLLITGAFDPIDEELREKSGADGSIIKPFEADDLLEKINTLLEERAKAVEDAVEATEEAAEEIEVEEEEGEGEELLEVVAEEPEGEVDEGLLSLDELEGAPEGAEAIEEISDEAIEVALPGAEELEAEPVEEVAAPPVEEAAAPPVEEAVAPPVEEAAAPPVEEAAAPPVEEAAAPPVEEAAAPEIRMPGAEEMLSIFSEAVNQRLDEGLREIDVKVTEAVTAQLGDTLSGQALRDDLMKVLAPDIKQSIDKVLWEIAPEITEKIIKETVSESLVSLKKEIQNIIWETVPELAETIIKETIAEIKADS